MIDLVDVLLMIRPGAEWHLPQNDINKIIWLSPEIDIPTEEEIQAKIQELQAAEPLRLLRIQRDQLLSQTDYITLRAYSQGQAVPQEWADYMQALRDLPETAQPELDEDGNLTNVEWPTKPE